MPDWIVRTSIGSFVALGLSTVPIAQLEKPPTELSKTAATIKRGTSQYDVIKRLGTPTWAILPSDGAAYPLRRQVRYELRWRNSPCRHVAVSFDSLHKAVDLHDGTPCYVTYYQPDPPFAAMCSRADRRDYCLPLHR